MSRLSEDPKLAHVAGHPEGCLCDECMRRMNYLDNVDANVDAKLAREDEARDYDAVPVEQRDRESARMRYASAIIEADRIGMARRKLRSNAESRLGRASRLAGEYPFKAMPQDAYKAFTVQTRGGLDAAQQARELAVVEREYRDRAEAARVVFEPEPYSSPDSPNSWVRDVLSRGGDSLGLPVSGDAEKRLARQDQVIGHAIRERTPYGRQIERAYLAECRSDDSIGSQQRERLRREVRALASGGGATVAASTGASAFIPPAILLQQFVTYRSPYAAFLGQLDDSIALPDTGLTVYLAAWQSGTSVAPTVEGSPVSEADPVSGYIPGPVEMMSGKVMTSQAVLDRAGGGIAGDVIVFRQLADQLQQQVNAYAIQRALVGAQAVTSDQSGATFALTVASGSGGFLGDLKLSKAKLTDTAGVRLRGTHCFASSDIVDTISSWADAQGRPVFSPSFDDNRLSIRSVGDQMAEGYSGYVLSGLALFAEDSIPLNGANNQVIVCRTDTIHQLSGPVITHVYPQGAAQNLESEIVARQYCTTIPRFPSGIAALSGAAYVPSNFA